MKKSLALIGMVASLLMASAANATLVTAWSATETDNWMTTTSTGGVNPGTFFADGSVISWGGTGDYTVPGQSSDIARSAVVITNAAPNLVVLTGGGFVGTTIITHYNNTITAGRDKLLHTTLHTTLVLTPTAPGGPARDPSIVDFGVNFVETSNSSPCGFESDSVCDDIFVLDGLEGLVTSFIYDGYKYTLNALGLGLSVLTDLQCAEVGKDPGCVGVKTQEGKVSEVQMGFEITAERIPEPAPLALLGLGLFALFSARRRNNS